MNPWYEPASFGSQKPSPVMLAWLWSYVQSDDPEKPPIQIVTPRGSIKGILHLVPMKGCLADKEQRVPGFAVYDDTGNADPICYRPQTEWWFCPAFVNTGCLAGLYFGDKVVWRAGLATLTVNGDTYRHRDLLKQHHLRWEPAPKLWSLNGTTQEVENLAHFIHVACPALRVKIDEAYYKNVLDCVSKLATVEPPASAPPFVKSSQVPKATADVEIVGTESTVPKLNIQRSVIL